MISALCSGLIPTHHAQHQRAFTLLELLVVVAIFGMLFAFVVPAVTGVLRGNEMGRAQQMIQASLEAARQTAIARNRRVEVRFYEFNDPSHPAGTKVFRGTQSFLIEENNDARALGKFSLLPGVVIINSNPTLSPALDRQNKEFKTSNPVDPKVNVPAIGQNYDAKVIMFRPDGSTDLEAGKDFFTIHAARHRAEAEATVLGPGGIPDYCVIKIDRASGATTAYRP